MPDIDVIAWYIVDQPRSVQTEAESSRYELEDFIDSQPIEGEEYVLNT